LRAALVALAGFAVGSTACVSETPFVCTDSSQCIAADGQSGICESTGFCSFSDDTCESGRRYGKAAGDGLASQCVEGGDTGCAGNLILAAGSEFTCALDVTGLVTCWGRDNEGQLGNGVELRDESTPQPLDLLPPIAAIDAGRAHACAVTREGQLYCWGDNGSGQFGIGFRFTNHPLPTLVAGGVVQFATGGNNTCWVNAAGELFCAGSNSSGQIGNDEQGVDALEPTLVEGLGPVLEVDVGGGHACARLGNGTVFCWGNNNNGQVGDGTVMEPRPTPVQVPGIANIEQLALGDLHSCARDSAGSLACWGANFAGQLADGTETERPDPTPVPNITAARVIAGGDHTCSVAAAGTLFCWGENNDGELGDTTLENKSAPLPVGFDVPDLLSVALGHDHTCAQDVSGQLRCWGSDRRGQLGIATLLRSDVPLQVLDLTGAVDVASGDGHSCAVLSSGLARCWGRNSDGELGSNGGLTDGSPLEVVDVSAAGSVFATATRACVHETPDAVRCFGGSSNSVLGDGSVSDRNTAQIINAVVTAPTAIAIGGSHSCAISGAAELFCWGSNSGGKLGNGTTTNTLTATASTAAAMPTSIAAGDTHTCAVDNTGALLCWGEGTQGQLGDGTATDTGAGAAVATGISNPVSVALGSAHSCAALGGGTVSCWGRNTLGQVGTDSVEDVVLAPATVAGLDSVVEVASDSDFTCARKSDGTVWCWGENDDGELGAGLAEEFSEVPVQVSGVSGAVAISAGGDHACAALDTGTVSCWGDNTESQLDSRQGRYVEPQDSVLACQ
jgi:alpha-tubulin suppressor-like RCC1 family protein